MRLHATASLRGGALSSRARVTCGSKRRRSGSSPIRCNAVSILVCRWSSAWLRSTPAHSDTAARLLERADAAELQREPRRAQRRQRVVHLLRPVPGISPMKRSVRW